MSDQLIAIYENAAGERREAYSPTDAVNLAAHGFTRVANVDPDTLVESLTPAGRRGVLDELTQLSQDDGQYSSRDRIPPPMGGAGSGTDEWREYAQTLDVDVADLEKRDDIVAAIRDAGHPVEQPSQ